ncbi:MAG TPA: molybdopterin-dependent oxidoreductase [Terriglobales bacterium]|nr:molybdopterin-dependent oxidoreductase [Terriglobales bacterium]
MCDIKRQLFLPAALLALLLQAGAGFCQQLTVQGENGKPTVLTRADIEALPHAKVTTSASGTSVTFEGVALVAVLEKAGVEFGASLKGKRLASYLLVEAADSYRVVIALPELDPAFTDKQTVLAFLKDGKPLDEKEGPYRVVIPDEKRMARWVRQVTTLKIVDVQ